MRVAIVGTGFSGLCVAARLKRSGEDSFLMFEQASEVGGTWRDSVYPGCACDVPSHLYSLSFAGSYPWSGNYGSRSEIQSYTKSVFEEEGLRPHLRLQTRVSQARYDSDLREWELTLQGADGPHPLRARFLVLGLGPLRVPNYPKIEGLDSFEGECFHSARWNHEADLKGRGIAVVGTGASAVQIVPQLASQASRLTLFQRTPSWIAPRNDRLFGSLERGLYHRFPWTAKLRRLLIYLRMELLAYGLTRHPRALELVAFSLGAYRRTQFPQDPEMFQALKPPYQPGCKRILVSSDFYPALHRPNVTLVQGALERVEGNELVAADGTRHRCEVLVLCTGYDVSKFLAPLEVFGREGRELHREWESDANAYLGTVASGYPNLFVMLGPNTGLGHSSLIYMMECQTRFILACLSEVKRRGASSLEVKAGSQRAYNEKLQQRLGGCVWSQGGCNSWYLDHEGVNRTLWPGFTFEYWWRTRKPNVQHFEFS